ncbi:UNVERIFIED_CONTAM: hypothetical protein Slati_2036800 [Sesamum latifolium]|uniref:Uncharacterized protein n=1 Tax=Sesamum latifolium TaxID=2727402 RepID=A0AAW2WTA9_9LAMI
MWLNVGLKRVAGSKLLTCWSARSKRGVGFRSPGEGLGLVALRAEGTASGWLHRAAITSRSLQWKDNGSVLLGSNIATWVGPNWTVTFLAVAGNQTEPIQMICAKGWKSTN